MKNEGTLTIKIYLGNAAFTDHPEAEIHRILSVASTKALDGSDLDGMKLLDYNGNIVGEIGHEY